MIHSLEEAYQLISDLEARIEVLEQPKIKTSTSKREERIKVKEALDSGDYNDLITQGGHGLIRVVADRLSLDLDFKVSYSTVYYMLRGN